MVVRHCNPGPVLPSVPWGFMEYEPGPKRPTPTLTHTKSHPSWSIPLSPDLTLHLNSKVRLFISLPHPIKPTLYRRMKPTLPSCCWGIRAEVETAVSDVLQPHHSLSRHTDKITRKVREPSNHPASNYRCSNWPECKIFSNPGNI